MEICINRFEEKSGIKDLRKETGTDDNLNGIVAGHQKDRNYRTVEE
jgi:hypothetical protein